MRKQNNIPLSEKMYNYPQDCFKLKDVEEAERQLKEEVKKIDGSPDYIGIKKYVLELIDKIFGFEDEDDK